MRIDAITVTNFRGIEHAHLHGLADSPLVTVSGPNGAGKSLLFEAIALLWRIVWSWERQQIRPPFVIGPWADSCEIEVSVALTDDEQEALARYLATTGKTESPERLATMAMRLLPETPIELATARWSEPLWSVDFTTTHGFANVDFFPADRTIPRGEQASVNPALLSDQQRESFRDQILGSFVQQRSIVSLGGIAPLLASLDYVDLLADRENKPRTGDFDALADAFSASTSKTILRPALDADSPYGSTLRVTTTAGITHTIDHLSSGEQEVLGLMYFVRRLSARGGVILIDEPELHLHPSLQRALFSALEATADRAQVWMATHSSRLVTAAPLSAIVHMVPAAGTGENQLTRASDEAARMRLLEDLGVHPIEALQSDALVVVEGATDVQRLGTLLPLELGRTVTFIAGNGGNVETVVRMLNEGEIPVPHLGIRDRDYLTDAEVASLETAIPNLFVWKLRSIESEILYPPLIAQTLERVGKASSVDEVSRQLREVADRQRDTIHADLVDARLRRDHGYEKGGSTPIERAEYYLREVQRVAQEKLAVFDSVSSDISRELDARWATEFLTFADGKRLLAEYVEFTGFASVRDFLAALIQTAHDYPELLPPGLVKLRDRLRLLVTQRTA